MREQVRILLFGSTNDSVAVFDTLIHASLSTPYVIVGVVTQEPKKVGRRQILTKTPVQEWAEKHGYTLLQFPTDLRKPWLYQDTNSVVNTLSTIKADLLISVSYGQKIPGHTISTATYGGINMHPSLLPRWRGADPVPWTILADDHQTGVSIITLEETFDTGSLLVQKKIPTPPLEADELRSDLFTIGAQLLPRTVDAILHRNTTVAEQDQSKATYAGRLTRDDGFIPWTILMHATMGAAIETQYRELPVIKKLSKYLTHTAQPATYNASLIPRIIRALSPWPGVWSVIVNRESRIANRKIKILAAHIEKELLVIDTVQLEGKKPVSYKQFAEAYLNRLIV